MIRHGDFWFRTLEKTDGEDHANDHFTGDYIIGLILRRVRDVAARLAANACLQNRSSGCADICGWENLHGPGGCDAAAKKDA
jgi:hypothetical protein